MLVNATVQTEVLAVQLSKVVAQMRLWDSPVGGLCDRITRDDLVDSPVAHLDGSNALNEMQTEFPTSPLTDASSSLSGGAGLPTSFCVTADERASN